MPRLSPSPDPTGSPRRDAGPSARVRALRRAWLEGTLDLTVDLEDAGMDRLVEELYGACEPERTARFARRR